MANNDKQWQTMTNNDAQWGSTGSSSWRLATAQTESWSDQRLAIVTEEGINDADSEADSDSDSLIAVQADNWANTRLTDDWASSKQSRPDDQYIDIAAAADTVTQYAPEQSPHGTAIFLFVFWGDQCVCDLWLSVITTLNKWIRKKNKHSGLIQSLAA